MQKVEYTTMYYTKLLGKTLRRVPQDLKNNSFVQLVKAGYIRSLGNGLISFLPLGQRVAENLKTIIRRELDALDGQEVSVPLVNPAEIWRKSGRSRLIGRDMIRFQDRSGRALVLSPSHEEAMVELVRISLNSYRDLPLLLYQFQTKFRDEERVRGGLIRAKEFLMKDAYSFHRTYHDLNNFFPKVFAAYQRIFDNCCLKIEAAESGVGYMGCSKAYEFMILSDTGDDRVMFCPDCGYRANIEVARGIIDYPREKPLEIHKVKTPNCETMERLAAHLGERRDKLAKCMVYRKEKGYVMAVVRGDYAVSLEKLSRAAGEAVLQMATRDELDQLGLVYGYLSPLGIDESPGILDIIIDESVANTPNLVFGANSRGIHYRNVNFGRDVEGKRVADITAINYGHRCMQCGSPLKEDRALEVGNIFKLDTYYSKALGLHFQNEGGGKEYPHMGSYGIGIGRLIAAIVEQHTDDRGICWPFEVAPYKVFLMGIGKSGRVKEKINTLYEKNPTLILQDDRSDSPGVKFKDADLLGIPYRVVISTKLLSDGKAELYQRSSGKEYIIDIEALTRAIARLHAEDTLLPLLTE